MVAAGRGRRMGYMPMPPWARNRMRAPLCHVRWDRGLVFATGLSKWLDISRHGNHPAQAVAGAQPLYSSSAGTTGKGGVVLDGIDDFLIALFTRPIPGASSWMLAKFNSAFVAQQSLSDGGGLNTSRTFRGNGTTETLFYSGSFNVPNATQTAFHAHYFANNGASSRGKLDDVLTAGALSAVGGDSAGITLGAIGGGSADWADCTFVEVASFDYVLSVAQEAMVNDYAYRSYGT